MLGAEGAAFNWTLGERAVLAGRVAWFYLARLVWPSQLLFVYPRWEVTTAWPWPLASLGAAGVLFACFMVRARWRAPLAVALIYLGTLFPALGFVNVYPFVFSFVADLDFAYVPSIAIIVAASSVLSRSRFLAGTPWLRRSAAAVADRGAWRAGLAPVHGGTPRCGDALSRDARRKPVLLSVPEQPRNAGGRARRHDRRGRAIRGRAPRAASGSRDAQQPGQPPDGTR